jgi:hypothetical protein
MKNAGVEWTYLGDKNSPNNRGELSQLHDQIYCKKFTGLTRIINRIGDKHIFFSFLIRNSEGDIFI